jgi:lysophospholipase L1-like esterase
MVQAPATASAWPATLHGTVRDGLRCLLLGLLWPILWLQGQHVRRVTPRMPEPTGSRKGVSGQGSVSRLLVVGDSGAAGVGVATQDEALCGHLVRRLSQHHTVEWCVLAVNGLDSPGLVKMLEAAPASRFDVVVLSIGANDATALCPPRRWVQWQGRLAELIAQRFAPRLLVHSAVPPMHACMALPQPLRWFMGRWANEMNLLLSVLVRGHGQRTVHRHPETTTLNGMAVDGLHPSSQGYALWADGLSELILATDFSRQVRQAGQAPDLPPLQARGWPRRFSPDSPPCTVWQATGL